MKTLHFNDEIFTAEKIIKSSTDIMGYDIPGNIIFSFNGISDFTKFVLEDEQTFDAERPNVQELQQQIFDLTTQLVLGGVI